MHCPCNARDFRWGVTKCAALALGSSAESKMKMDLLAGVRIRVIQLHGQLRGLGVALARDTLRGLNRKWQAALQKLHISLIYN